MKKLIIAAAALFIALGMGTAAFAKTPRSSGSTIGEGFEFDGSFQAASGPGDYDSGFGINFGAGYTLSNIDPNLQARFDLSYLRFKHNFPTFSGTYERVPFTVSARYYFPIADKLRVYGQAGLETSVDSFDNSANRHSNEVNLGISPGAGIEFFVAPNVSLFALSRAHLISDSYFTMQFGVATYF